MSLIKHSAVIAYSAPQMYDLVNAVEAYPQFLPWCKSAQINHYNDQVLLATLEIAKGGIHKTFTTRNVMTPSKQIVIDLVEGPFEHLSGRWEFKEITARYFVNEGGL